MKDRETTIGQLKDEVEQFVADRNWQDKRNPKNVAGSVVIEAAELLELFQWANHEEVIERLKDSEFKDKVRMEAADVLFYLLSMAQACDFDLSEAFYEKLAKINIKYPANIKLDHETYHRIKEEYRAGEDHSS